MRLERNVMTEKVVEGDWIICRGDWARVLEIETYPPGAHPDSPIRNDWAATKYTTRRGARWKGENPDA